MATECVTGQDPEPLEYWALRPDEGLQPEASPNLKEEDEIRGDRYS